MTRLVALLCFYDEQPGWLHDTIISLEQAGVDHLVAADGGYRLFPDATASSSKAEHVAIFRATRVANLRLTLHVPTTVWEANEVEKRTRMFRLGEKYAPDWYLIIDADEVIVRCPTDLKAQLAATSADYADVMSLEQNSPIVHSGVEGADWPQIHYSRHVKPRRCLIRAVPGLTVGPRHFDYVTPDGRNLWGDEQGQPLKVPKMMIDHRNKLRDPDRHGRALDYYRAHTAEGAEPDPSGLPAPKPASAEKVAALNARLAAGIRNYRA